MSTVQAARPRPLPVHAGRQPAAPGGLRPAAAPNRVAAPSVSGSFRRAPGQRGRHPAKFCQRQARGILDTLTSGAADGAEVVLPVQW